MTRALRLLRTDFCNLENDLGAAISIVEIGIFVDDNRSTAYAKIAKQLEEMEVTKPYVGWDLGVYPTFSIVEAKIS